ncbi:type IV toxin-antitoxin system AbiEi family antitoxin domain-containing protein [Segatella copri]|uniref:type IV toxin-antitoxin system AbiEi family antitoxin domain-containing protein n=1 Tax=Segatella copri TaxID=165179 RepID=UPI003F70DFFB
MDLEHIGNIPVSTSAIASLFTNIEAGNQKVRSLEAAHKIIRLKKGLYVVAPNVSRVALSTELIANHLYAPSYVSMQTALRYYGLIPEAVYTTQSMTLNMDISIFERYAQVGKKSKSIETLIKYLRK